MTAARTVTRSESNGVSFELDEAFLLLSDRAALSRKQNDPHRMDQIHRALEEEVYLANANGAMYLDRPQRRDPF